MRGCSQQLDNHRILLYHVIKHDSDLESISFLHPKDPLITRKARLVDSRYLKKRINLYCKHKD